MRIIFSSRNYYTEELVPQLHLLRKQHEFPLLILLCWESSHNYILCHDLNGLFNNILSNRLYCWSLLVSLIISCLTAPIDLCNCEQQRGPI